MKNRILSFFLGLSAVALLIVGSCATLEPMSTKKVVKDNNTGVAQLVSVRTAPDGSKYKSGCTAFHIGNEQLLTAAHCFKSLYLILSEDESIGPLMKKRSQVSVIDAHGHTYRETHILKYNIEHDMVLMQVPGFDGGSLSIWNPIFDGEPEIGSEIIALGYPGYFSSVFTFDIGLLKEIGFRPTGLGADGPFIISRGTLFPGYSGGPTLSMENGKVIGLNHAGTVIPTFRGTFVSLSLAISYETILRFLKDRGDGRSLSETYLP